MSRAARLATTLAIALALAPLTPRGPASARPWAPADPGVQLGLQLGANVCVADAEATCEALGAAGFAMVAPGYRFTPWFSLSLDVQAGWFAGDSAVWSVSAMPTARFHLALGPGAVILGAGVGYDALIESFSDLQGDRTETWSTLLALKATLGYLLDVTPRFALGVEANAFLNPDIGTRCTDENGVELCEDVGADVNVAERLTVGLFALYRF